MIPELFDLGCMTKHKCLQLNGHPKSEIVPLQTIKLFKESACFLRDVYNAIPHQAQI